jgi:hypothetical protein
VRLFSSDNLRRTLTLQWQAQAKDGLRLSDVLGFLVAVADHVAVHGVFSDLPPQVLV